MNVNRRGRALVSAVAGFTLALALVAAPAAADDGDNRHPSGKDRSVEAGGSGTQGRSTSDPDGDANGGPDKPGGAGGIDRDDQDGNNGCGNDDDFEDDNNGNCGPRDRVKQRGADQKAARAANPAAKGRAHKAQADEPAPAPGPADADTALADTTVTPAAPDAAALGADVVAPNPLLGTRRLTTADALVGRSITTAVDTEVLGVSVERQPVAAAALGEEVSAQAAGDDAVPASLARTGFTIATLVALALGLLALGILIRRWAAGHR